MEKELRMKIIISDWNNFGPACADWKVKFIKFRYAIAVIVDRQPEQGNYWCMTIKGPST